MFAFSLSLQQNDRGVMIMEVLALVDK